MATQGMEIDLVYGTIMSIVVLNQFSKSSVPDLDTAINGCSCNTGAIRSELTRKYLSLVLQEID